MKDWSLRDTTIRVAMRAARASSVLGSHGGPKLDWAVRIWPEESQQMAACIEKHSLIVVSTFIFSTFVVGEERWIRRIFRQRGVQGISSYVAIGESWGEGSSRPRASVWEMRFSRFGIWFSIPAGVREERYQRWLRERERERERVKRNEEREKPWHLLHDCSIWPLA
jgi:hypothetical protein